MTKKIMIDPGHGGNDPGAVGNGLQEKNVTLIIAKKIKEYLNKNFTGHVVMLTRTGDTTLTLNDRTNKANAWGADYFLSIHINAGGGTGFESFIYDKVGGETEKIRGVIHEEVMKAMPDWRNRGKKKENFHVLRETRMPAMLTENGFIDTKEDADKLKNAFVLENIAKGHAEGLARAFNLKRKEQPKPKPMYKVQVGAFINKANAQRLAKELQDKGYPVYIVKD